MKLAILGGSFNPIHIGHLALAETALLVHNYHRLIFIPAFQSPLKSKTQGASVEDRLDMLLASIAGDPRFGIDDCEVRRGGVSYTIDTIDYIEELYRPEGKLGFILGDDLVSSFHLWKKADELADRLDLLVAGRIPSQETPFPYPHTPLENDLLEVSSGDIRERISSKRSWQYLLPPGAAAIIMERGLYGFEGPPGHKSKADKGTAPSLIVRLEEEARRLLSLRRFLHSRNTALMAWDLCQIYGLDCHKGYLAGICHDICKLFDDEKLLKLAHSDGAWISSIERKRPSLLHGRAAAVYIKKHFNVEDKDVLEAVRMHTFGGDQLGKLAKAVYIADKLETGRTHVSAELRKLDLNIGLDVLFNAVIGDTVDYLKSRSLVISRNTLRAIKGLNGEKRKN